MTTKVARDLPADIPDRILSIPQTAKLRNVSVDTIKRGVKRGDIKAVKLSPRRVGVWLSEAMRVG